MSETETHEPTEPTVTDVPEPDQEPHEPIPDEADEQGEADADEAGELESEREPEPQAQGLSQVDWEKRFVKAEKAFETYRRRVADIFEEDALDLMPFSISPSAPPGFLNKNDVGRVPQEVQDVALEFFGLAREQEYEPDPETETCRSCKGKGKTKTGSVVGSHESRPCPTCKGWGYTIQGRAPSDRGGQANGVTPDAAATVEPLAVGEVDNWDQPRVLPDGRLNPNYGRMPQYWEHVEPWGETRGLTAQDAAV